MTEIAQGAAEATLSLFNKNIRTSLLAMLVMVAAWLGVQYGAEIFPSQALVMETFPLGLMFLGSMLVLVLSHGPDYKTRTYRRSPTHPTKTLSVSGAYRHLRWETVTLMLALLALGFVFGVVAHSMFLHAVLDEPAKQVAPVAAKLLTQSVGQGFALVLMGFAATAAWCRIWNVGLLLTEMEKEPRSWWCRANRRLQHLRAQQDAARRLRRANHRRKAYKTFD